MSESDLNSLIRSKYSTSTLFKIVFTTTLSCFVSGYNIGVSNLSMSSVAYEISTISEVNFSAIHGAIFPIGATFGSVLAGKLANRYGRRNAMRMICLLIFLSSGLSVIPNEISFFIGRFIAGISAGMGVSIPPAFINEILPDEIRGTLSSLVQFQITFGIFCSNLMCLPLPTYRFDTNETKFWMLAYGFPVLPAMIKLLLLSFVYDFDSPAWLLKNQRPNEHEKALKMLYGEAWEEFALSSANKLSNKIKQADPNYRELFIMRKYRRPLIVGCVLAIIQQMVGINAFIFYSGEIFSNIQGSKNFSNWFTVGLNFVNMSSTMICLLFIEKKGRKFMMIQGIIGMGVCNLLAFFFGFFNLSAIAIIVFIFIYIMFFESSSGSIMFIYLGETLTDRGVGIAVSVNWFFTAVISSLFPILVKLLGISYLFLGFAVICFFSCIYCLIFMKETRGKSQEEIEKMLEGN